MGALEAQRRGKSPWRSDPLGTLRLAMRTTLFRMKPCLEGGFYLVFGDRVANMIAQTVC